MLTPYEIIRKKRDGGTLSREEIGLLISSYTSGDVPDYQMSSFLMAVYFSGMSDEEILNFTQSMMGTGIVIDLSAIPGCKADKHSTGGVGDKISLILAPLAAACGVKVPMVSGRGLGHTGGTIDKLESIPGFRTRLSIEEYKRTLASTGIVMSAQSDEIVPADRKLYALRDVTATVESIPLITSSIMSKKLAEGIDALVLDVKVGNGAFMKTVSEAKALAKKMVKVGKLYGKQVVAYLTDMNQPLGHEAGNWREVVESIRVLRGESDAHDVIELSKTLTAEMVSLCSGDSMKKSMERVTQALSNGAAYEKFIEMVKAQGGDSSFIENPEKYPPARFTFEVPARQSGYVHAIDSFGVGMAVVKLGGGRRKVSDVVDPVVGVTVVSKIGEKVSTGDVLALVHANDKDAAGLAVEEVAGAYKFSGAKPKAANLIKERIA